MNAKQRVWQVSPEKRSSLAFLSLLCFALADVRDGLGPFFGVWLQSRGWTPDAIGFAMTLGGLAGMLCTTPLGALADHTPHKRALLGLGTTLMALSCGMVFLWTGAWAVSLSIILQGAAAAAFMPALTGITLGLVGQDGLATRLGTNAAWNNCGNAFTAALGGMIGYFYGIPGVFFVLALMAVLAVFSLIRINPAQINYAAARGLDAPDSRGHREEPMGAKRLFADKALLAVALTLFFFHLGNAALLPLLGQSAVAQFNVNPAVYTAGTVILAQVTMIVCALWGARTARKHGYGPLFLTALAVLPLRGCIAGLWESPWNIIPVQVLDGVGAGLMGVATPGLTARILQGSGRINMGLGLVLTIQGVGAALSNAYGGLFAHHVSYGSAFFALAAAPCLGLVIFVATARFSPVLARAIRCAEPWAEASSNPL